MRWRAALVLLALAGCSTASEPGAAPAPIPPPPSTSTSAAPTVVPPPTTAPPTTTTTAAPSPVLEPVPVALATALAERVADPRFDGTTIGASVWVEGYGEVLAVNPDTPLLPASNQKLYTAMAALAVLGPDATLPTEVRTRGADLVLVGGGDPTLSAIGPHSLDALAAATRAAGVTRVTGDLVLDGSHLGPATTADGWFDWHVPGYVPPVTALTVDDNRHRADAAYLADPALGNLALFRAVLGRHGVTVDGVDRLGPVGADSTAVARLESPPVAEMVGTMLRESDNLTAELLLRSLGSGSWADGIAAADAALAGLDVPLEGTSGDGSGLSRLDRRSAREWRLLLQAAEGEPWGDELVASLPVAGRTGTLAGRFVGTPAEGNLRAKTGWILVGRALSGHLTTAGGRAVTFSVVVNDTTPESAVVGAIDDLVVALAADPT